MLQVITSYDVPDSTYFRTASVDPDLDGDTLTIYDGKGTTRSSWGAPGVTSTVVVQTEQLVAVHVGFFHKHGGGQFWRYYRHADGWQLVTWAKLSDDERQQVLQGWDSKAPSFAKVPGKLRVERNTSEIKTRQTYKIVQVIDGRYFSVYNGAVEYIMGKRLAEKAVNEHGGGYYSYPSQSGVLDRFAAKTLFPSRCFDRPMDLAVVECEISGTIIEYPHGKYASTYIRPMKVVHQFSYTPEVVYA